MPPRHARQRARPEAAARNREAAQQARAAKPAKAPARPQTFREQRTAARGAARTRARATLAKRAAGVTPEGAAVAAAGAGARAAKDVRQVRIPTGNRQYQGVIVAEFLVAVLIVAVAPLARGKAAQDKTGGPSPYGPDDIKQLAGIGAVYFILALLSSGNHGRLAAWFGGLVLVAIGLAETTSGGLPAIFGIFQPSSASSGAGEITPAQEQQILNQAAAAAQSGASVYPTQQQIFEGASSAAGGAAQVYTFTRPGVITTDSGNQSA